MRREASIDPFLGHRYNLLREWDPALPKVGFCMANPSIANGHEDDPTATRCINFARSWGYGGLWIVNLATFIATEPKALIDARKRGIDIYQFADGEISSALLKVDKLIAAWGKVGQMRERAEAVKRLITEDFRLPLYHLGLNLDGSPKHPLYLKASTRPVLWIGGTDAE
jgi:hypothetical protein